MRLINAKSMQLEEYFGKDFPPYAILSHTWGHQEVSFSEFQSPEAVHKAGYQKISYTCEQALKDGLEYAWIDTCCIDKSSSSELSEAINSMFQWYTKSSVCYAYLSDVSHDTFEKSFRESRWFHRGWTLQELIAPDDVIFFDWNWQSLGSKKKHSAKISQITSIHSSVLWKDLPLRAYCVAERMSWAANRETTRLEDVAYSLLGIFDVNMALLYGEGTNAFIRLQEEIIKRTTDETILAWDLDPVLEPTLTNPDLTSTTFSNLSTVRKDVLAISPDQFKQCGKMNHGESSTTPYIMTNHGLEIELPLVSVGDIEGPRMFFTGERAIKWIGLLNCSTGDDTEWAGILLEQNKDGSYARAGFGNPKKFTFVLNARMASVTTRKKIIISHDLSPRYDTYQGDSGPTLNYEVLINLGTRLKSMGYSLVNVVAANHELRIKDLTKAWDRKSKIFSVKYDEELRPDLLFQEMGSIYAFHFKSDRKCPNFIVIAWGLSDLFVNEGFAVVWDGSSFPPQGHRLLELRETLGKRFSASKLRESQDYLTVEVDETNCSIDAWLSWEHIIGRKIFSLNVS